MSGENESKLVFDTLIGNDTLTHTLQKQLDLAVKLTTELKGVKEKVANSKKPLTDSGVSLVDVSSLRTAVQLLNAMHLGAGTLEKMSIGLGTKDLTTIEGIVGAMAKLVGLTEKYSQLSNKKLQLAAFDGTLTKEQFDQHKGNINALKAMNKGFAQGQAHLDAEAQKWAKEGIKLVEQHTKKLKQQAAEKNRIARQEAAESGDTRSYLKRRAAEGAITRTEISKAKTPEELKAIQSGITDRLHDPKLTKAQRARAEDLERMTQTKLVAHNVTPFETQSKGKFTQISDFQNLTPAQKAESKVGLSLLARRIATLKKEGGTYAQVVAAEALHQAARDLHATKFRPASAFQLREAESLRTAQAQPRLTDFSSLTNRGDVAQQLRMSNIRAKNLPEGVAKDEEKRYSDALRLHGASLVKATKEQQKNTDYLHRLNTDPAFHASELLKHQQGNLKVNSLTDRVQLAASVDNRLQIKAENERTYRRDAYFGTYGNVAAIQALATPQEHKDARNSLNFQANNLPSKAERDNAEAMLRLLKEKEALEKHSVSNQTLIKQLAETQYRTTASLNGLNRQELEMAQKVLQYRRDIAQTPQARLNETMLLNHANTQQQIQTKAEHRLNPEYQAENRAGSRERILGDAGASVLTIQAGLMLNYKLLAGMQGLFSSAIGSVIELDSAFRQLQAISASTNTEMVSMKQNLILVAQASKFSAAEVGNTAVLLAQAGFSIGEISQSMKGIIALAQATGTDLSKSVDVVTSVLSVFNKGAGETDQVVNQLTEALNRSKLDINKMALGIQYAGNIAADSGITFEELTASLGAMANAGIRSGSTLGTGLRQMFIDLQKPSEKLKEKLSGLGLSLDQVDLKSYGLIGVLENLKNAGFTTGDAFKTFEVRAASAFAALSGNMDDFNQLKEGLNDTTAAFDANGVQLEALAVQLDHLKSNLGILSAEALMPVAALVRDLAKATAHAMEKTEEGTGVLKGFGTVLAGITFGVAVGWLAKLGGELSSMVWGLTKVKSGLLEARAAMAAHAAGTAILTGETLTATAAAASLRTVLWSMAPVIVGVVGAVGLVTLAWSSYGNEVEKLNEKLDKAKAAFNKAKESVNTAKTAYDNVNEAIDRLSDKYGVLKESQVATTTEAESLVTQFGAMGFALDDLANTKVEKLMEKLRELRGELSKEYTSKIGQELAAKVDALLAEKDAAKVGLEDKKFSPKALQNLTEGLTHPEVKIPLKSGYVRGETVTPVAAGDAGLRQRQGRNLAYQIKDLPTISLLAQYLREIVDVQKKGVPKGYNLPNKEFELEQVMANSKTLTVLQREKARDFFKDYIKTPVNAANQIQNFEPNKLKATQEAERKESRNKNEVAATDVNRAVGSSERARLIFEEQSALLDATGNKLTLKARELAKGELGKKAVSVMKANLANVDKALEPMNAAAKILEDKGEAGGAPYFKLRTDIGNKEAEKAAINKAMQAPQDAIDKALGIKSKGKLQDLQILKGTLEEKLKALDRDANSETGVSKQAAKAQLADNMQRQIDAVELQILELSVKKDADLDFQRVQTLQKQTVRLNDRKREEEEKQKNLKAAVEKRTTDIDSDTERTKLTDYKQAQQDWVEANNLSDELFAKAQSAARKRAALQGKKVLNAGNMFKDINKDLAKAAQDAANATGQAQEYSSYGTGIGGFFARQAANAKNGVNEGKLKQEALAREFLQLKASEDHYSALKLEETIPKAQKELAAKNAELKAIDDKLKNSNLSDAITQEQTRKDLQVRIDRIKEQLKTDEDLLKMSKEDRERRLATIERLTEDLAAMQDKTNVFADSFAAGRQALDAGLGTIVNDWATQTIKNIDDVEAAFKAMGLSILQSMLKVVSDRTAMAFTNLLLGKADGSTGLGLVGQLGSFFFGSMGATTATGGASLGSVASSLASTTFGALAGQGSGSPIGTNSVLAPVGTNSVLRRASGGPVSGTGIGHDSVPAMLTPNEYVLRPSAASALGKPFLDRLNATTTGSLKQLEGKAQAPQVSVVQSPPVSVYVVSPDQKQQMSPQDVVVTISDDISRNGSIKRLIKQVISGEV